MLQILVNSIFGILNKFDYFWQLVLQKHTCTVLFYKLMFHWSHYSKTNRATLQNKKALQVFRGDLNQCNNMVIIFLFFNNFLYLKHVCPIYKCINGHHLHLSQINQLIQLSGYSLVQKCQVVLCVQINALSEILIMYVWIRKQGCPDKTTTDSGFCITQDVPHVL